MVDEQDVLGLDVAVSDADNARRRWRANFLTRVRMMERILAGVPDDNVPTPRTSDDDDDEALLAGCRSVE